MRKGLSPEELGDFLELPLVAVLATCRRDGTVLLSPVWHEWRDGGFNVVTRSDDIKATHLRRDRRASIAVAESSRPYRGVELRCDAKLRQATKEEVERIAVRYLGDDAGTAYTQSSPDDILVRLEPGELRTWDFADDFPSGG